MTQAICFKNKFGYCKYTDKCKYRHVTLVCDDDKCEISNCEKRHPKICKYFRDYRRCKFTVGCKFKHENSNAIFEKFEKELENIKKDNLDSQHVKEIEEKFQSLEEKLNNQQKEIEVKNALICQLELRLSELENKFVEEKKNKEKKVKELEDTLKHQKNKTTAVIPDKSVFECEKCEFTTLSKIGLSVHFKRVHTKLYKIKYPVECDFCEDVIKSGKEMDLHLKFNHNGRGASYKCEDCDYIGENGCSLDVHHGKCHNIDFECGLCDYKGKDVEKLETHLTTCEAYLCCECNFRGRFISSIRTHMLKEHGQENVQITHAKLDRKDNSCIVETEHWSHDLFEN